MLFCVHESMKWLISAMFSACNAHPIGKIFMLFYEFVTCIRLKPLEDKISMNLIQNCENQFKCYLFE